MTFERIVTFEPAFDKRAPEPSKNYGVHCVTLRMVLRGELGATQFVLYTGWNLPNVTDEMFAGGKSTSTLRLLTQPMAVDLGYHWLTPTYEGLDQRECDLLPGGHCHYDGSGLNAEPVMARLIAEGSDAVWSELETYYEQLAGGWS